MAWLALSLRAIAAAHAMAGVVAAAAASSSALRSHKAAEHAPTAQVLFQAEVPRGLRIGSTFQVQTPDGQVFSVVVSPELEPGSIVNIPYTPRASSVQVVQPISSRTQLTPRVRSSDAFLSSSSRNLAQSDALNEELDQLKHKLKTLNAKTANMKRQMASGNIAQTVDQQDQDEYAAPQLHVRTVQEEPSSRKVGATRHHIERKLADFFGHLEDEAEEAAVAPKAPKAVPAKVISIAPPVEEVDNIAAYAEEMPEASPETVSPAASFMARPAESSRQRSRRRVRRVVPVAPSSEVSTPVFAAPAPALPVDHLHSVGEMQEKIASGDYQAHQTQLTQNVLGGLSAIGEHVQEGLKYKNMQFRKGEKIQVRSKQNPDVWYTGVVAATFDRPGVIKGVPVPAGVIQVTTGEGTRLISRDDFFRMVRKTESSPEEGKVEMVRDGFGVVKSIYHEALRGAEDDHGRGIAVEDPLHEVTELQNQILKTKGAGPKPGPENTAVNAIKDMFTKYQVFQALGQQASQGPLPAELMTPVLGKMQGLEDDGTKNVLKEVAKKLNPGMAQEQARQGKKGQQPPEHHGALHGFKQAARKFNPGMAQEARQERRGRKEQAVMRLDKRIGGGGAARPYTPTESNRVRARPGMLPMRTVPTTIELAQLRGM